MATEREKVTLQLFTINLRKRLQIIQLEVNGKRPQGSFYFEFEIEFEFEFEIEFLEAPRRETV